MADRDWYSVLGVSSDAPQSQIREAYIRISRVVHPDRFDPQKQPVEWRQANEMLKHANRAYDVLSSPEERARYDRSRTGAPNPTAQRPRQSASQSQPAAPTSAHRHRTITTEGGNSFEFLPERIQNRLLERQANKLANQCAIQTHSLGRRYFWTLVVSGWFVILWNLSRHVRWEKSALYWYIGITALVSVIIAHQVQWIWRWHSASLKCRLYVTPLYIIQTFMDSVRWWPLFKLQDIKVTHNYRNGSYQDSDLLLVFANGQQSFSLRSRADVDGILEALHKFNQSLRLAVQNEDWDYFVQHDDMTGAPSQSVKRRRFDRVRILAYGASAAIGLVMMLAFYSANSSNPSMRGLPPTARTAAPSQRRPTPSATRPKLVPFNEPPRTLPDNGHTWSYVEEGLIAPLEVRTRGTSDHYFMKVVDVTTGNAIAAFFVRGGLSAETYVPVGTYRIRYATGKTWYGTEFLFGPETAYHEAAQPFTFSIDGDEISGYTVELYPQKNGNLGTKAIRPDQF